jgi:hypothetical protein
VAPVAQVQHCALMLRRMRFARTDPVMRFREATGADAMAVAMLHAESWRVHYRGAYRDEYLNGDVVEDRIRV